LSLSVLADENVDWRIVQGLRSAGFNVISVMEELKSATDKEVIDFAKDGASILLTQEPLAKVGISRLVILNEVKNLLYLFKL